MVSVKPIRLQTKLQEQFCPEIAPDVCGMVIFGASGDLAERKLFPSLYNLRKTGVLPPHFYAIGVGRTSLTDESFREKIHKSLKKHAKNILDDSLLHDFLSCFHYHTGDYADPDSYQKLALRLDELDKKFKTLGNRIFYLSIPPSLYEKVVQQLGKANLAQQKTPGKNWSRIIIEKPFGHDINSARKLNKEVSQFFKEDQIYRIDHYLGKETVQSIMVLRFANVMFEPLWNRNYVDHIQITAAESIGIGHRAGYYEEAGALRDMFQNHILQLLCITAMEAPSSFHANRVRDEKSKVLRAIRPFPSDKIDQFAVKGQYGPGRTNGGENAVGYREEKGVSSNSKTETFAALKMYIDNWRWQGVPFYLRSGKRLPRRVSEIVIQFKRVPHVLFQPLKSEDLLPNALILRIHPSEGLSINFETKHPGPKLCMSAVNMDFDYESSFGDPPEAYERLFLDCMAGDQSLFIRSDWVDISWSLLAPLLEKWKLENTPVYDSGTWGPAEADRLLAEEGHKWKNIKIGSKD